MSKGITFTLAQPDKVIKSGAVSGVIIPTFDTNLTIISGRAPTMVNLSIGLVQLLDSNGSVAEKYFIKGGVASVANDVCSISSEIILCYKSIDITTAEEKMNAATWYDEKMFYQLIIDELIAFK